MFLAESVNYRAIERVAYRTVLIAIGVLVVGRLLGFAGLFVELELPPDADERAPGDPVPEPFALEKVVDSP